MKSYKIAIILVVILGILACAYLVIKGNKDSTTAEQDIKVINISEELFNEVNIKTKEAGFVFTKKGQSWVMSAPNSFEADVSKIEGIIENLSTLTALRAVEDNASDITKYGLDKPTAIITIKATGSDPIVVNVGDKNSVGDGTYVNLGTSHKVYLISSIIGDRLNVKINDMRKIGLFPFKSDEITSYTLEKSGKVQYKIIKTGEKTWKITTPVEVAADSPSMPDIMDKILSVKTVAVIENDVKDLAKYGLDTPTYAVEVTGASKTVKLLFGKEESETGRVYVKLSDSKEVYTVSLQNLDFLDKPLKEVMDPFVYIADISTVSNLEIDMDGYKMVADMKCDTQDTTKDKISVNGKDVSQIKDNNYPLFRKLYEVMSNIPTDDIDLNAKPSGTAEITIAYKDKTGTTKVEFIPRDNDYYYAVVNGKYTGNLIFKKQFNKEDGMSQTLKKIMDIVNKK